MKSNPRCMPEHMTDDDIIKTIQSSSEETGAFSATNQWGFARLRASIASRGDTFDRGGAVVLEKDGAEVLRIPVAGLPSTLGSGTAVDFVLEHAGISRLHCHLESVGSLVRIVDDGSTNGLLLNRKKIVAEDLCEGDELALGSLVLRVRKA